MYLCDTRRMQTTAPSSYKGFRFPQEIISHAVWLYFRFSLSSPSTKFLCYFYDAGMLKNFVYRPLSFRDVEELLAERGLIVTYETIR